MRAGLNLDASPVPDDGSVLVDPFDETQGEGLPVDLGLLGARICGSRR